MHIAQALLLSLALTACGGDSGGKKTDKTTTEPGTQQDGKTTVKVAGNSDAPVTVSGPKDSKIKKAAVTIPPGALSVDTTINVEEGTDISVFGTDLTTTESNKVGPAVMVTPQEQTDPTGKILINIPAEKGITLTADYQIAVIYQVRRFSDGKTLIGLALGDQIKKVTQSEIEFESPLFGIFQVVKIPKESVAAEKETAAPILSKSVPLGTAVGHWILGCRNVEAEDGGVNSVREWIAVKPDTVLLKAKHFTGFNCIENNAAFDIHMVAKFEIGELFDKDSEVRPFDITPQKIWARPLSATATQSFSSASFCGVSTWTVNVQTELTTATPTEACALPAMNQVFYGTVIMTDEIFIAPDALTGTDSNGNDGKTAEKRYTDRHEHPNIRTPDYPFEEWVK